MNKILTFKSFLNESFHKEGYYEEIDDLEYDEMLWMNDSEPDEDGQQDEYYKTEKPNVEDFTQREIEILSRGKKYEIYGPGSDFPSWEFLRKVLSLMISLSSQNLKMNGS